MVNKETFKGFVRGFVVTSLILLVVALVFRPTAGWAQGGGEKNPHTGHSNADSQVVGDELSSQASRTDDPLGREPAPVEDREPHSNQEAMAVEVASLQAPGTDDPQGREPIPVAERGAGSNQEAMVVDSTFSTFGTDAPAGGIAAQDYGSPLVISAADFSSDGVNPDGFQFWFIDGSVDGWDGACLKAPAYLPEGATVTEVWASVFDNDAASNVTINLRRVDNYTGNGSIMAALTTTGSSTTVQTPADIAISNPLVAYPDYSYYVTTCLDSVNVWLYSVRIYYTQG